MISSNYLHIPKPSGQAFLSKFATIILCLLLISGCTHLPKQTGTGSQDKLHTQRIHLLKNWRAKGKIKITVETKPHAASFDWQQFNKNYTIRLFGPFGIGTSWLRRTSKGVTLETPKHPKQWAKSAEALMDQTFGWHAPVTDIQYWIKGSYVRSSQVDSEQFSPLGYLTHLKQDGWQIQFSRHKNYQGIWLPTKIRAKREEMSVLVVIKEWVQ